MVPVGTHRWAMATPPVALGVREVSKRILWFIKGHLIWKTRKGWVKVANNLGCYGGNFDMPNRLISAYEFWRRYSPINSAL